MVVAHVRSWTGDPGRWEVMEGLWDLRLGWMMRDEDVVVGVLVKWN